MERYLENKTGFYVKLSVVRDKQAGFTYAAKISLDTDFKKYSKWVLYCNSKKDIAKELLSCIAYLDIGNTKNGSTIRDTNTKIVKSKVLKIECCQCHEEKSVPTEIHRNLFSELFKNRAGYVFRCNSCITKSFIEVYAKSGWHIALLYVCGQYDRFYYRPLADQVMVMELSPQEKYKEYLRLLNMVQYSRKGRVFIDSDLSNFKSMEGSE
jgi:hypothetical protein